MIPQSFIQDLLGRVDIVDVVGKHVRLKKSGANYLGLCPFHGEKSPSFTVSAAKQFYHCFGCGAHGSAIGFVMAQAGLGYVDAIHELARAAGLTVPDDPRGQPAQRRDPDLLETLAAAARYYKLRLKDSPQAIGYLKGRGVTGETAARFAIGFAPDGARNLEAAVPDYAASALLEAGLVAESEPEPGPGSGSGEGGRRRRYDRFRNRIMFPIRNPRGQVIGFGGRLLDGGDADPRGATRAKYVNSPETPLFHKGRELYGQFEAREAIRAAGCVIVVEGYMDVVMLAQHGVSNVVAALGTATTEDHVHKLLRLADRVVFAFDGDAAGRRAAWRALEACLKRATDTKRIDFLFLPPEHDPDSFVRERGAAGFEEALSGAQPLSAVFLDGLAERAGLVGPAAAAGASPEACARLQADARDLLLTMPPVALRLQLAQAVAARAGVRIDDFLRYLESAGPDASDRRTGVAHGPAPAPAGAVSARGGDRAAWAGGRWARDGDRRGRGPDRDGPRWPQAPLPPPDLQRRARLLLALHPALARESRPLDHLPPGLPPWIARVAALPEGATFAQFVEGLRAESPQVAAALEAAAARDGHVLGELGLEEARHELDGALNQLRGQAIRDEVDRLAEAGLDDDDARRRYAELQRQWRALSEGASP